MQSVFSILQEHPLCAEMCYNAPGNGNIFGITENANMHKVTLPTVQAATSATATLTSLVIERMPPA